MLYSIFEETILHYYICSTSIRHMFLQSIYKFEKKKKAGAELCQAQAQVCLPAELNATFEYRFPAIYIICHWSSPA
jgi:hypothetical protein